MGGAAQTRFSASLNEEDVLSFCRSLFEGLSMADSDSVLDEYYLALGRFMHSFASVETTLATVLSTLFENTVFPSEHYNLAFSEAERKSPIFALKASAASALKHRRLVQLRQEAIRAMLGPMRTALIRDSFKRLLIVTKAQAKVREECTRIFSQLSDIQNMRDRISHNGATLETRKNETWFFTTDLGNKHLEEDHSTIHFQISDINKMSYDLGVIPDLLAALLNHPGHEEVPAPAPFQYKSSALVRTGPKFRSTPATPKPRQKSSQE